MQYSNLDEDNEELSPEKPIQKTNKYQLSPILFPNTSPRKLQDVHTYYSKQSVSPLSNNEDEEFEHFEDLQLDNSKNYNNSITDSNTYPNSTASRSKSQDQVQLSQYMFNYKSNQKISIPRASLFKIQHMSQKTQKQTNLRVNSTEKMKE